MHRHTQKLSDLIAENHVFSAALHLFGILFYRYKSDTTLHQVCEKHHIRPEAVIKKLEELGAAEEVPAGIETFSPEVLVAYLKHMHTRFVKEKLPYISRLVADLNPDETQHPERIAELKMLVPDFFSDLIAHIYEEEDELFVYINQLSRARHDLLMRCKISFAAMKQRMFSFWFEHANDEGEVRTVRKMITCYGLKNEPSLTCRVLYRELCDFEHILSIHANIENKFLMPKAFELEKEIRSKLGFMKLLN